MFYWKHHRGQLLLSAQYLQFTFASRSMLNEALPSELLTLIWSFADSKILKRIRFVNKRRRDVATKYLFEDVFVTLLPLFLRKLESISNHEHLSEHVKTLGFHSKLLDSNTCTTTILTKRSISGSPFMIGVEYMILICLLQGDNCIGSDTVRDIIFPQK